ncbi:MAG: hypothetical protein AAFO77_10980, partial [Pseudomonadota bacterium]
MLQTRIDFIRYSLADIVARGDNDDFGFFRVLNRISFASLNQLAFLICSPAPQSGAIAINHQVSVFDEAYQEQFIETLAELGFCKTNVRLMHGTSNQNYAGPAQIIDLEKTLQYRFQLFQSDFQTIVFRVVPGNQSRPALQPDVKFQPIEETEPLGRFIFKCLEPFDGRDGRTYFRNDDVKFLFQNLFGVNGYKPATAPMPSDDPISGSEQSWLAHYRMKIDLLVAQEYDRHCHAPITRTFLDHAPQIDPIPRRAKPLRNIAFFAKRHTRNDLRFNRYPYNVELMLGGTQYRHLKFSISEAAARRDDFIPLGHPVDDVFWSEAAKPDGPRRILKHLVRRKVGSNIRLFPENALLAGCTMIRRGVFTNRRLAWLDSPDDNDDEWMRVAALHYFFQLLMPSSRSEGLSNKSGTIPKSPVEAGERLSVVAFPFRASGGIFMVGAFTRIDEEHYLGSQRTKIATGLLDHEPYEVSYLYYHSIFRDSERRIRRRLKELYLDAIGELAYFNGSELYGGAAIAPAAYDRIRKQYRLLTRVFPFPQVELLVRDGRSTIKLTTI